MKQPWFTLILGFAVFVYGMYIIYMRIRHPESLVKLIKMKQAYGSFQGNLIHFVFYALFPLAVSILLFLQWYAGIASI